jgi:hypothetical protein
MPASLLQPAACRSPAASAYRALMRAVRATFRGDAAALARCRAEARAHFARGAALAAGSAEARAALLEAHDAARFLRQSIVQASLNAQGRYAMRVDAGHGDGAASAGAAEAAEAAAAAAQEGAGAAAEGEPLRVQDARTAQAAAAREAPGAERDAAGGCGRAGGCGCVGAQAEPAAEALR